MICYSVTHPQSSTNTAIAQNIVPLADITTLSAKLAASNGKCSSVSQYFIGVS